MRYAEITSRNSLKRWIIEEGSAHVEEMDSRGRSQAVMAPDLCGRARPASQDGTGTQGKSSRRPSFRPAFRQGPGPAEGSPGQGAGVDGDGPGQDRRLAAVRLAEGDDRRGTP